MIDEGPSANLPPHMILEFFVPFVMRTVLFMVLVLNLAACDRGSSEAGQEFAGVKAEEEGEAIESGQGLVGKLDISQRGSAMVDTSFQAPDGSTVQLSDFIGKPVLVNIWATWCAPCIVEMPMLDKLAAREKERLKVLVVSQDLQGAEKVVPFFARGDFEELEPYVDPENGLSFGFGSGLMPTTVLYDAQGEEVWRVIGAMDWDGAKAAALLEQTLAEN
ncbi:TlpA family protein disulfide reductase [Parasphingorhabdus sp.]|uniref:TlpA family protein disulfide reductase n=1 Tax=Parasphingorhabdus sp. TaxID=2709688 RepID=UPI003002993C